MFVEVANGVSELVKNKANILTSGTHIEDLLSSHNSDHRVASTKDTQSERDDEIGRQMHIWGKVEIAKHTHTNRPGHEFDWAGRPTDGHSETDRQTDRQTERHSETDRQTERHSETDRQTDRQTDTVRQTDRQTDRSRNIHYER